MAPSRARSGWIPRRHARRRRPLLRFALAAVILSALAYLAGRVERRRREMPLPPPPSPSGQALPSLAEAAGLQEEAWRRFPAPPGERLVYSIDWGLISVGEVMLEVVERAESRPFWLSEEGRGALASRLAEVRELEKMGALKGPELEKALAELSPPASFEYPEGFRREAFRIRATAKASAFINALYKVDYRIETLVDAEGTFPWRYDEHIVEGRRRRDNLIEFDQRNHAAYYYRRRGEEKGYSLKAIVPRVSDRVQDPLSILYYVRLLGMSVGQAVNITVQVDGSDWPTLLEVIGTEKIDTGTGELECLVVRPRYDYEGLFVKSSEPRVWLDKESRIPVKMDVKIPVGTVKVLLKEWHRPGEGK